MLGFGGLAKRLFGSANERAVKALGPGVAAVNALEPDFLTLSDDALRAKTPEFRARLANGTALDELLPEAFAAVREAAKRVLGQRHFDVQLAGGMVLHQGKIAEMKTGEGKTLAATLPAYLNALTGKGVHVVTVNDYLAKRDSDWMGRIYRFLGMEVGCITHGLDDLERRAQYAADITYGTNNEFGFDYLRDNMKYTLDSMTQRGHHFAIVDEVDSILIDEARTPLIISGPTEDHSNLYRTLDSFIPRLVEADYEVDEKTRVVTLTEEGNEHIEDLLRAEGLLSGEGLYDVENVTIVHHLTQALRANKLFEKDKDYIVKDGKVVIIDEFTGRMMEGRRYSDGLHQALEAKEVVEVQPENQTLASITFQNYFRLYDKLSGMTGTASTEAAEFEEIYNLQVVEVPTNVQVRRADEDDEVYRTADEKYEAMIAEIAAAHAADQPVLVGTTSIEKSEHVSRLLKKRKIPHNVLNARYHEQEAQIIALAGRAGAVTIATNMAGRGTDIQLGGNLDMRLAQETGDIEDEAERQAAEERIRAEVAAEKQKVLAAGGLYVIGTERHESRRIDNQLRGRSGRQGDPGRSRFYLSLEDDLMRIFGSDRMDTMLRRLGLQEGEAIIHPWINKAVARAQEKVEARNFDIRKNLLKFDNVMNDQRTVVFEQRREFMGAEVVSDIVTDMRNQMVDDLVAVHVPEKAYAEQWDLDGLHAEVERYFALDLPIRDWGSEEGIADDEMRERLRDAVDRHMAQKAAMISPDMMRQIEKAVLLQTVDHHWREHLQQLEQLRQVIGFRGYAQKDPLNEYKSEAFALFENMLTRMRQDVTAQLARVQISAEPPPLEHPDLPEMYEQHLDPLTGENEVALAARTAPASGGTKVARNAPCPCGSGRKYKHCHGKIA